MFDALVALLSLLLNAGLPYLIVKRDLARLSEQRLERAWTNESFLSAVLTFGPLSLPVHFTKTRRSLAGLALGIAMCGLALAAQTAVVAILSAVFGVA